MSFPVLMLDGGDRKRSATLFVDEPTNRVGVNQATPLVTFDAVGDENRMTRYSAVVGESANFSARRARGTVGAPTAVALGDALGTWKADGYHSGGAFSFGGLASMVAKATEAWTAGAQGAELLWFTTPNTTTTPVERLRLRESGLFAVASLTASSGVYTDASKNLTSTPPTTGVLGYWTRSGTTVSLATPTDSTRVGNETGVGGAPVAGVALSVVGQAVAATAETIARFAVSDDATGKIEFVNGDATNGVFVPRLLMLAPSTFGTQYVSQITTDAGGVPVVAFAAQTAALGAIVTRHTFGWFNLSTEQMSLSAAGLLKLASLTASLGVYTDASKNLTSTPPTSGVLGYWTRIGTALSPATLTDLVGIGTTTPTTELDVVGEMGNHRYNAAPATAPGVIFFRARGTAAAPTVVLSGDRLGCIDANGYNGAAFVAGAQLRFDTTELWTVAARGTKITFATASNLTTLVTDRMTIDQNGNVGIGLTPGAFKFDILRASSEVGVAANARIIHNDSTNTASHAFWQISTTGAGGGDPYLLLNVSGVTTYYIGIDNSDSDKFMIGLNAVVGAATPFVTIDTSGNVGIGISAPVAQLQVNTASNTSSRWVSTSTGIVTEIQSITGAGATGNIWRYSYIFNSSTGVPRTGVTVDARLSTITNTAEIGEWEVATMEAGAAATARITVRGNRIGFFGVAPVVRPAAYTRNAVIVESRTLLASASATVTNNNNVLAALIVDLQGLGILA